jgi:hypothetical protein
MNTMLKTALLLVALLLPIQALAAPAETITLNLPESVLANAVKAALPLDVESQSKSLRGTIKILGINNLQLGDKILSCRLHVAGSNLQIVSELAGHQINLKVGEVELDFDCTARLRFDAAKQVLYIKPVIDKVKAGKDAGQGDLGQALVSLMNGREFPISMEEMEPLIARTGSKTLIITMKFVNIQARRDLLQFSLLPKISRR